MNINQIYNEDCLVGMNRIPDNSVDCILTDPPYKYLKNQKLEVDFDEDLFFNEAKRVLKTDGFIVLFGRGTSFYRWNTRLADLGFAFKEEIVWDKGNCTSPLLNLSRVHETVSIHTKKNGSINKVKIPYLEMKGKDLSAIIGDVKRMRSILKNPKSLQAVQDFIENNYCSYGDEKKHKAFVSIHPSEVLSEDRGAAVFRAMTDGLNEKSIIRTDMTMTLVDKSGLRRDMLTGDRCAAVMQSVEFGLNEKSIIKQTRDHYSAIHPTQKPVRLLERLLALVTKPGDTILDPFAGSCSTGEACYNKGLNYILFEIDEEYYEAGMKRLREILLEPKLAM